VKALVVDDKWMASLEARVGGETTRVAQSLTRRVKELSDRYGLTLPALAEAVEALEREVAKHLARMGHS
jgi:type I restriction enzyme M protein